MKGKKYLLPELRSENMTRHPGFWVDDWETSATSAALMGKSPDGHKAASAYLKNLRKDMVHKPVRLQCQTRVSSSRALTDVNRFLRRMRRGS